MNRKTQNFLILVLLKEAEEDLARKKLMYREVSTQQIQGLPEILPASGQKRYQVYYLF